MPRTATYTIQGFLYQFNKSLLELLRADYTQEITLEGPIEDIDISDATGHIQAIQCKYHEAQDQFTTSKIYKPILQMLLNYCESANNNISYRLFLFFPNEEVCKRQIELTEIESALSSTDADLRILINEIKNKQFDLNEFQRICTIEFGPSLSELEKNILSEFSKTSLPKDSIETLYYPNAINEIAHFSIKHSSEERTLIKTEFLKRLQDIRKIAISKWTLALKSRDKILKTKRSQLKGNLAKNSRERCFVIDNECVEDFYDHIVGFIKDYIDKYHSKSVHDHTPIFYLKCSEDHFQEILRRLYKKGVGFNDGKIAGEFEPDHFFRQPVEKFVRPHMQRDFSIRIANFDPQNDHLFKKNFDDVFIISKQIDGAVFQNTDTEVEYLSVSCFTHLRYVLGLTDAIE